MLDTDLIRTRRRQLGLSQRAVGRAIGVPGLSIARLEDGVNTDEMTLRTISRLADLLGVTPTQLLAGDAAEADASTPTDDVARIGALLAAADRAVTKSTLADALTVTIDQVEALLDACSLHLDDVGMALQRSEDGVRVVTTLADDESLQRLLHGQHAAHGLTATDATLLARAIAGSLDTRSLGNDERVALARLHNAGMLDDCEPTAAVRRSMRTDLGNRRASTDLT